MSVANRRVAAQIAQQSSARAKRSGRKEPRTEESFAESNARFRRNGVKVAYAAYGWWRPRRYKVMWDAWKFARICQRFGWNAWRAPYEARKEGISPEAEGRAGWPNEVSPQGRKSPSGHHRLLVPGRRFAQAEHRHGHPDRLRPRRTRGSLQQDRVACRGGKADPLAGISPEGA